MIEAVGVEVNTLGLKGNIPGICVGLKDYSCLWVPDGGGAPGEEEQDNEFWHKAGTPAWLLRSEPESPNYTAGGRWTKKTPGAIEMIDTGRNLALTRHRLETMRPISNKTETGKRFHRKRYGGWDLRCFGGWLVCYNRDVFCLWWSNDATPPTKREGNGFWIVGSYGKWAQSKYA